MHPNITHSARVLLTTVLPKRRLVLAFLMLALAGHHWPPPAAAGPSDMDHPGSPISVSEFHRIPARDTHLAPAQAAPDQAAPAQAVRAIHLMPAGARLDAGSEPVPKTSTNPFGDLLASLGSMLKWILILCFLAFLFFLLVVALVLWKAKQLVANAVKSDPVALAKLVDRLRRKHPKLDDRALCKKIILRQSNRAGLVGFVTGVGGLPTLPLALPIDIAATIRIQANMVHMLRLVKNVHEDEVPEAGLWLATTGGMELATAGSTALREVVVKIISKSLLKFLPLIGGVIGFGLNWASTQTMGRLGLKYMDRSKTIGPSAVAVDTDG